MIASTFYLTTGLPVANVIVGMLAILFLIARTWTGACATESESADTVEYFIDTVLLFSIR